MSATPKKQSSRAEASPYMTVKSAAAYLNSSEMKVRRLLTQRRLTTYKAGGSTLLLRAEVERFVQRLKVVDEVALDVESDAASALEGLVKSTKANVADKMKALRSRWGVQ